MLISWGGVGGVGEVGGPDPVPRLVQELDEVEARMPAIMKRMAVMMAERRMVRGRRRGRRSEMEN